MTILNNDNFKEFINKDYVLVDFYADWCGPCKMMHPVLEEITTIEIGKVDVTPNEALSKEYQVLTIPTLILFKKGQEINRNIGFISQEDLNTWINNNK